MAEISVIMPVYNAGSYLAQAVNSILTQTFTDFEFLICDDCSTDASGTILQQFAARDNRIKLFRNEKNSGIVVSLNKLLSHVSSPYIARMDADDIAIPERLEKQYRYMQKNPHIHIAGGQLEVINEKNETLGYRYYSADPDKIFRNALCGNPLAHPAVIMRKQFIESLGGYRDVCGCEDYELWLRALQNGAILTNLPDVLLRYRINSGQIKQRDMKRTLWSTIALQQKYLFTGRLFSFKALLYNWAEIVLLLCPNKMLLKLFMKMTYRK